MNKEARMGTDYASMGHEALLHMIQQLAFVAYECQLFLDTHPECKMALDKFHRTHDELALATEAYHNAYGPLVASGASGESWDWVNSPWPWQTENGVARKAGR